MRLIGLTVVLTLSLVLAPVAAGAEQAGKIPRLCFLTFDSRMTPSNRLSSSRASPVQFDPFFQRLHDLGYVDGQSITIDYLSADGQGERFPALATDCLRLKADIIVVTTTPAAQAAKNATRTIPIVMFPLGDPVGTRLVASLARPGGNVTGMTSMASLGAKRLNCSRRLYPDSHECSYSRIWSTRFRRLRYRPSKAGPAP